MTAKATTTGNDNSRVWGRFILGLDRPCIPVESRILAVCEGFACRTAVPSRREDIAARSKPRSRRRLGWSFAIALLLLAPPVFAQAPDATWNLTGTDATNSITDCFGTDYSGIAESGDGCQSYTTDTYENWDGSKVGSGDTDIQTLAVGLDSEFFYFDLELRESWDYDSSGSSHSYQFELDLDPLIEVSRGDYLFAFSPLPEHVGSTWIVADSGGSGQVQGFEDPDDDVGGPAPVASDYDCGSCTGYETGFIIMNDVYVRIVTRGGKQIPQLAIRASTFGAPAPTEFRVRTWAMEALAAERFTWHDRNDTSDLGGISFDNTHGADTSSWLEPTTAAVTPVIVKRAFWSDGTPIPTGATIPSGIEFKYLLYVNNTGGAVRQQHGWCR